MKKVLLTTALVFGSILSTLTEISLPYSISEQYALPNGCIMTLSGNGTITVNGDNVAVQLFHSVTAVVRFQMAL